MKKGYYAVWLWFVVTLSFANNLQRPVDHLINEVDPAINMGVSVVDLNTGEILFERNPDRAYIPASNMKLFSDAAALMILGPDYHFKTRLSTNAPILDHGTLKGSLYVHLSGDPSLTSEQLQKLFSELTQWGVKDVQGNIILVSQNRYIDAYAPGWMMEDLKYSYGAPIAPVILDENRLIVTVNPAHKIGEKAIIELNHDNQSIIINNQVNTKPGLKGCGIDFSMDQKNQLTVRGCVGLDQWAVTQGIAIRNPLQYMQSAILSELNALNITLHGNIMLGNSPSQSILLGEHSSKPISQILADTLKPSDNLYADSLFLQAAAKLHGGPVNWGQGQKLIKQFLEVQTGINLQSAVLTDGSGLSRYDQLTPHQTVALLKFLHHRFPLAYEYIAALPIAGQDGTLQKRFRKPEQRGLLRAKTGTMKGVVSLSGYLYTANEHTLAFAIYINGMPGTSPKISGRYRYLVDALCSFLLKQNPSSNRAKRIMQAKKQRIAFQKEPTQAEQLRLRKAKWRRLESALKHNLKGHHVAILYRGNELVLNDYNGNYKEVWHVLKTLRKKHSFAVSVQGKSIQQEKNSLPIVLWVQTDKQKTNAARIWKIRETI